MWLSPELRTPNYAKSQRTASIYGIASSCDTVPVDAKGWNKIRVKLSDLGVYDSGEKKGERKGMNITVSMVIGGKWKPVTTFDGSKQEPVDIGKRQASSPKPDPRRTHGEIALQSHASVKSKIKDTTAFRNIRWRLVTDD